MSAPHFLKCYCYLSKEDLFGLNISISMTVLSYKFILLPDMSQVKGGRWKRVASEEQRETERERERASERESMSGSLGVRKRENAILQLYLNVLVS
jgi:hypothetical protein